jgi:hypothetical protein
MKEILAYWDEHGTKVLGSAAAIVAALLVTPDLIPPGTATKILQAANIVLGVLTVRRGFTNSQDKPNA